METWLDDGRVPIDNNQTGRSIRPSAVGKKNRMFVGHPEAGARTATLYSLLESAKNHGADPQKYLQDIIEHLPGMTPGRIREPPPGNPARAPLNPTSLRRTSGAPSRNLTILTVSNLIVKT